MSPWPLWLPWPFREVAVGLKSDLQPHAVPMGIVGKAGYEPGVQGIGDDVARCGQSVLVTP